jgi:hypothetical protein
MGREIESRQDIGWSLKKGGLGNICFIVQIKMFLSNAGHGKVLSYCFFSL